MENFVRQLKSAIALSRPFFAAVAAVIKRIFEWFGRRRSLAKFRYGGAFPSASNRALSSAPPTFLAPKIWEDMPLQPIISTGLKFSSARISAKARIPAARKNSLSKARREIRIAGWV